MVLKKPYAFLIKHFKLIHLLLCIPLIYLIIRTGAVATFFSSYVSSNYYTNVTNIAASYINYFMYFATIFVILLVLAIFFLMRQKEKDTKLYLFMLCYYILFFVLISVCYNALDLLEAGDLEAQVVRGYRDVAWIIYIPQFFFVLYTGMRGVGFDIKKFNFEEDVKELEITDIDNEEFELVFGKDSYKYKRTVRRFFREFRYYVLENKIIFSVMAAFIAVLFGTLLYLNYGVYHKTFRQSQKMNHNGLQVSVVDSVLSNLDLGGNVIDGKYYMAIAMQIQNNTKEVATLDYENFRLQVAKRSILATLDRASYFADLGIPYSRDTKFLPGSTNTYVFTYEVDESLVKKDITLRILESLQFEMGSVTSIYKTINLKYDTVSNNKEERTINFGKILELSNTRLGLVQIQLNKFLIQKSYEYQYGNLKNRVSASSSKQLLVLEKMFSMDPYTDYYKSRRGSSNFTKDFFKLEYSIFGQKKVISIKDVTPKEVSDFWFFEVPDELSIADKIDLLVTIRGSTYRMEIK